MNNRSIAWWLRQIGLPQYTKTLESEYYGLEGLLYVTDGELKDAGIEDAAHRETILTQLSRDRQRLDPLSGSFLPDRYDCDYQVVKRKVSRQYSLGSSSDLPKDLFRQHVLPRLHRTDKKHRLSASCSQLRPLDEDSALSQEGKRSKRKSISAYFSHLKMFGGRKEMDILKKELEEELKLSTEDLRSHAWYHGSLRREAAETLFERDGDFLVRDSSSTPGDYVLSCFWKNGPHHFKIIKVVLRPKKGYSRELFQFEEDRFDNVPALIRFYVGGNRPISKTSGAIISHPINRTIPLRVISEGHMELKNSSSNTIGRARENQAGSNKRRSLSYSQQDTLQVINPLLRSGSQPANLENVGRRPSLQSAQSDSNLRTGAPETIPPDDTDSDPISPVFRTGSEPLLSPRPHHTRPSHPGGGATLRGSDGQLHPRAPPKPLRVSTVFSNASPLPSTDPDEDPSSYYSELIIRVPQSQRKGHVDRLRAEEKWQSRARLTETSFGFLEAQNNGPSSQLLFQKKLQMKAAEEERDWHFERPHIETSSCFQLDQFTSLLLPDHNRPLESNVLLAVKELFSRSDTKTLALHMLSVDCQVARIVGVTDEQKRIMGVNSGLELVTLPHGHQLRQDLLERHHLITFGVAVDILGCTGTVNQRATVLHKVILLAQALKEHVYNLFSFSAVMKALEMTQIVRLEMTWRALRRNHTECAVLYEKKLRPFMNSLNEGNDSVVQGPIAVPHLVPLLMLMEGEDPVENNERGCQVLYDVLQSARSAALHAQEYEKNAQTLLTDWTPVPELLETFRTEFALRLFWGQQGAAADKKERYEKFDKVLCVLSDKLEPVEVSPQQAGTLT
ncbi:breast cancer anti-estrogen resistance protein 3 homolog isoform X2 [Poeciliopsis prolifica]|uniref:breast cancer anti-estrogen resistance protein 3 homolog isoform X2 n=1 Tax=Poeciliopsis prolifica TaxID=188132 RepID=UPI002413E054|nr:breast cancer anti-estrogen resistance protein 3 homolog isoform X2 [Poeciliopsis prolifica]